MPTRLRTLVLITGWFMSTLALVWWSRATSTPLGLPPAAVFDLQALTRTAAPPLGLPPVPVPDDNPLTAAKIRLGRKLFFDRRLSRNNTMSCAMCHVPEQGFTVNELAQAVGIEGRNLRRNAPTLLNVAYMETQFHDGRETSLETQVISPLLAHNEMANPSMGYLVQKLCSLEEYADLFVQAFQRGPSVETIGQALARYERTLLAAHSPFDRWYYGQQHEALSPQAQAGFRLFVGKAQCVACHTITDQYALFTDQAFHNTGLGWYNSEDAVVVRYTPPECLYAAYPSMWRSRDMYRSLYLLCSLALPVLGLAYAARADEASDAAVYRVSYIEVMPSSQGETMALLRQYREASRQEEGNVRLEVLQQNGRPDHFVLLETWKDQKALDAHGMATHTVQLRDKLQPLRVSPFDERLHKGLAISAALAVRAEGATYVVTHADAVPSGKDEALVLLKQLAETSRNDDGNVRFEVLQQSSRQNHCTIVEVWKDQKALAAHVMAGHTRQFREKFQPLSGSLYDERLYTALD